MKKMIFGETQEHNLSMDPTARVPLKISTD